MLDILTAPTQALLYRLCGDRNPLHADPAFARSLGYDGPILHGLCLFGIVGVALQRMLGPGTVIDALKMRFVGVFFPGETLSLLVWAEQGQLQFEGTAVSRKAPVLGKGSARYYR